MTEPSTFQPDDLTYSEKYVAFLDVLGFKEQVKYADTRPEARQYIGDVIGVLRNTLAKFPQTGFEFTHFSDCIVLSAERSQPGLYSLIWGAVMLSNNLLNRAVLIRGGITIGNITHTDDILFGTGMVDAYQMDRSGSPPRISVTPEVADDVARFIQTGMFPYWIKQDDHDLSMFVHTLLEYEHYDWTPKVGKVVLDGPADRISKILASNAINMNWPPSVRAKWRWMRNYWNMTVATKGILPKAI